MKKIILILIVYFLLLLFIAVRGFSADRNNYNKSSSPAPSENSLYIATSGDYRSNVSPTGLWDNPANWETYNGVAWVTAPHAPDHTDGVITISNGDSIRVNATASFDQVIVENNAVLTFGNPAVNTTFTLNDGPGIDMENNGRLYILSHGIVAGNGTLHNNAPGLFTLRNFGILQANTSNFGTVVVASSGTIQNSTFSNNGLFTLVNCILNNAVFINNDSINIVYNGDSWLSGTGSSQLLNKPGAVINKVSASGIAYISGAFPFTNNGSLKGIGEFIISSTLSNNGTLATGGKLKVNPNFFTNKTPTIKLNLRTTGATPGVHYDELLLSTMANTDFSGTTLNVIDNTNDPVGTVYTLVSSPQGTISGQFTAVHLPPTLGNLIYTSNSITVQKLLPAAMWTGSVNTDWNDDGNWFNGIVPTPEMDVSIGEGATFYPVINGTVALQNLDIETNASITLAGGALQIGGIITNAGILDASEGTVEMNGLSAQTIPANVFASNKIKNLIISNDVDLASEDTLTGTLTVAAGKTFTTNDNLILHSDENGTARIATLPDDGSGNATAFITGKVNIERYIPMRKAWRLLSAPVKTTGAPTINQAWQESVGTVSFLDNPNPGYGVFIQGGEAADGFDQGLTTSSFLRVYNNATNTFTGLPAIPGTLRPITDYTGYFLYVRGDRSIDLMQGTSAAITPTTLRMKGQLNTGDQTANVNATGYTVFGNPFASAIDFETLTKDNVKNSFYVWDPQLAGSFGLGAYVTFSWNSGTGMYDATTSASPLSKYIPSGEAIIVESDDGLTPGTITVKESDKTANGSDAVFGRSNGLNQQVRVNLYAVNANSTTSLLDGVLTTYDIDNINSIENDDAKKLNGGSENIGIKRNATMLSIERRKEITGNDTTFLNIYQMKVNQYQLEISMNNLNRSGTIAMITDSYSNTINNMPLDMNGTTKINFSITADPASYAINRFRIVFKANVVLPVTITSLKAYRQQDNIAIEWKTSNEINIKQYEVERSADGRTFTKINSIGATAVNGGNAAYSVTDTDPFDGTNYYRIHSVENDGKVKYSSIAEVMMQGISTQPLIVVYPNPVTGNTISVQFNNIERGNYALQLFNATGQLVFVKTIRYNGTTVENVEVPENFAPGKYELRLLGDNIKVTTSVIKR